MSYAHDINLHKDFDREAFAAAVEDVRILISHVNIDLAGPSGRPGTRPIFESHRIAFNGVNNWCKCDRGDPAYYDEERYCPVACSIRRRVWDAPDDQSFQPLWIDVRPGHLKRVIQDQFSWFNDERRRDTHWFDCKTRLKPYNLVVMLVMLALKHHLGRFGPDGVRSHQGGLEVRSGS